MRFRFIVLLVILGISTQVIGQIIPNSGFEKGIPILFPQKFRILQYF